MEFCFDSHSCMALPISLLSQSDMNLRGTKPISAQNCCICVRMSSLRSLNGYIYFCRVALSIRNSPYLTPLIATREPNIISMCIVFPKCFGSGLGCVFLLGRSMVAVRPRSIVGSWSWVLIEKLSWHVSLRCLIMLSIFRNPNPLRS